MTLGGLADLAQTLPIETRSSWLHENWPLALWVIGIMQTVQAVVMIWFGI